MRLIIEGLLVRVQPREPLKTLESQQEESQGFLVPGLGYKCGAVEQVYVQTWLIGHFVLLVSGFLLVWRGLVLFKSV
ncbi:hypothetical protein V3M64_04260, partial [Trueperella pyogenes]